MIFFITVLRALAACLITNSHYTGIYPTDLIANGGLIGDIIFFSVSGYCLYNVKLSFPKWYAKRLYRVYLPVLIATISLIAVGCYSLSEMSLIEYLIYPTFYHFVASIIVLYIPYYIIVKYDVFRKRILTVMVFIAVIMFFVYVFVYDKSYYHIDNVKEPFIRFLFFESMLLGAYFKEKDSSYRNKFSVKWILLTILFFGIYFASKLIFSKLDAIAEMQILNQYIIFILLFFILRTFAGLDNKLENLPKPFYKSVNFIANITLEIYVVQYALIDVLRQYFEFPINWIIITGVIIFVAFVLHIVCKAIYAAIDAGLKNSKK